MGGSDVSVLMGLSRHKTIEQLYFEKANRVNTEAGWAMERGKELEAEARQLYETEYEVIAYPCCVEDDADPRKRVSLDGLTPDGKIMQEIKAPKKEYHELALDDEVPPEYIPQMQYNLARCKAEVGHFISYHPDFSPGQQLAVVVVPPNSELQRRIDERVDWFLDCLERETAPEESLGIVPMIVPDDIADSEAMIQIFKEARDIWLAETDRFTAIDRIEDVADAVGVVRVITEAEKRLDAIRKAKKDPFLTGGREVDAFFSSLANPLSERKEKIKDAAATALKTAKNVRIKGVTVRRQPVVTVVNAKLVPKEFWVVDEGLVEDYLEEHDEVPPGIGVDWKVTVSIR